MRSHRITVVAAITINRCVLVSASRRWRQPWQATSSARQIPSHDNVLSTSLGRPLWRSTSESGIRACAVCFADCCFVVNHIDYDVPQEATISGLTARLIVTVSRGTGGRPSAGHHSVKRKQMSNVPDFHKSTEVRENDPIVYSWLYCGYWEKAWLYSHSILFIYI